MSSTDQRGDEDEAAVRQLLERQVSGWNAGDPEIYASVFTPDADYITFLGGHHKGGAAIAASYVPLLTGVLKGSRLHTDITQLRFLTPDVALIQVNAALTRKAQRKAGRSTRVNTSVAVRTGDGWLLAASQNTVRRRFAEKVMDTFMRCLNRSVH